MIRAPVADLASGERRLDDAVTHYVTRVLRLRAGDTFVAFDPRSGQEADATILGVGSDVTVRLGTVRQGASVAPRRVTLLQGLPKGTKSDAIVRDATELGATRIIIAAAQRSVVRLDETRALERQRRWDRIAREATRQCGRSDAPKIAWAASWSAAVSEVEADTVRFCLWERATEPLAPSLLRALASGAPVAFACGPEGGLEDSEVDAARARGWSIASLGGIALRTETVAAAVLGAVVVWGGK